MPDNQFASPQPWSKKKDENNPDASSMFQHENQKILLENAELKKKLEKEKLFHTTLYKQWTDLNASIVTKNNEIEKLRLRKNSQSPFYKYSFFGLLLLTVILAVSAYTLSANRRDKDSSSAVQNIEQVPASQNLNTRSTKSTTTKKETSVSDKTNALPAVAQQASNNKSGPEETGTGLTIPDNKPQGNYRVISKSYFCNEPDGSTRRNTFVLPDSTDYGILTALDDKNGFIYIVFTNHKGRISKGWISKSDLEKVN